LKNFYLKEKLLNRLVAIVNLPSKQITNLKSEYLILAAIPHNQGTILLKPDKDVEPGAKIF